MNARTNMPFFNNPKKYENYFRKTYALLLIKYAVYFCQFCHFLINLSKYTFNCWNQHWSSSSKSSHVCSYSTYYLATCCIEMYIVRRKFSCTLLVMVLFCRWNYIGRYLNYGLPFVFVLKITLLLLLLCWV